MDHANETPELTTTDPEMRQLLGLFDVPAFARRGYELEFSLDRLGVRCRRERREMLDMVIVRLRQWASVATGPDDEPDHLVGSLAPLRHAVGPVEAPWPWAVSPAPKRRRIKAARELAASVDRFNRRWLRYLNELKLDPLNLMIDRYNAYYLLEKECAFGSSRVASRSFRPMSRLTPEGLLEDHPLLPAVELTS